MSPSVTQDSRASEKLLRDLATAKGNRPDLLSGRARFSNERKRAEELGDPAGALAATRELQPIDETLASLDRHIAHLEDSLRTAEAEEAHEQRLATLVAVAKESETTLGECLQERRTLDRHFLEACARIAALQARLERGRTLFLAGAQEVGVRLDALGFKDEKAADDLLRMLEGRGVTLDAVLYDWRGGGRLEGVRDRPDPRPSLELGELIEQGVRAAGRRSSPPA